MATPYATYKIQGNNYKIKSTEIKVSNLEEMANQLQRTVEDNGGTLRSWNDWHGKKHSYDGYYNRFYLSREFFINGVIVDFHGQTALRSSYFVDTHMQLFEAGLSVKDHFLGSERERYKKYSQMRECGLYEQIPKASDPGIITLSLEGSIRSSQPDFYAMTGLPKSWPIPISIDGASPTYL